VWYTRQLQPVARRVLKAGGGKSAERRRASKGKSACLEAVYDAAAIGNKILADLWVYVHTTGCEADGIAKALRGLFAKDVTISSGGTLIIEGTHSVIEQFVGAASIEGSITELCLNHFASWYAASASAPSDNTFVFYGNELTSPQNADGTAVGMLSMSTFYKSFCAFSAMPLTFIFAMSGREYTIVVNKTCEGIITAANIVAAFPVSLGKCREEYTP
jgi:hypothetical protein